MKVSPQVSARAGPGMRSEEPARVKENVMVGLRREAPPLRVVEGLWMACLWMVHPVPPGPDPAPPDPEYDCDLSLLANRLPDREQRVEEFFLKAAAKLSNKAFLLGGNGWEDKPVPANVKRLGHVFTKDHNALNSSALAVLNINRGSMARVGFSPPVRLRRQNGRCGNVSSHTDRAASAPPLRWRL